MGRWLDLYFLGWHLLFVAAAHVVGDQDGPRVAKEAGSEGNRVSKGLIGEDLER